MVFGTIMPLAAKAIRQISLACLQIENTVYCHNNICIHNIYVLFAFMIMHRPNSFLSKKHQMHKEADVQQYRIVNFLKADVGTFSRVCIEKSSQNKTEKRIQSMTTSI